MRRLILAFAASGLATGVLAQEAAPPPVDFTKPFIADDLRRHAPSQDDLVRALDEIGLVSSKGASGFGVSTLNLRDMGLGLHRKPAEPGCPVIKDGVASAVAPENCAKLQPVDAESGS